MRRPCPRWAAGLALAACLAASAAAAARVPGVPFRVGPAWLRARELGARADSLQAHGRNAAARALLDTLVAAARESHDDGALAHLLVRRGGSDTYLKGGSAGLADLEEAERIAIARRDTLARIGALRWLAFGSSQHDQREASASLWRRMRELSIAYGSDSHAGWAELGLAYLDLEAGRLEAARVGYRRSIARLRRADDRTGLRQARIGLARVLDRERRYDEERALTTSGLAEARATGDLDGEATMLNNLGACEYQMGEHSDAVADWREALARMRELGRAPAATVVCRSNIAMALMYLGHFDDAASTLDTLSAEAAAANRLSEWAHVRTLLARVRLGQGRNEAAAALAREVLARPDSLTPDVRLEAALALASAQSEAGKVDDAIACCAGVLHDPAMRADEDLRLQAYALESQCLVDANRPREALALADEAERAAAGSPGHSERVVWLESRARAWALLGQPDRAYAAAREAAATEKPWIELDRDIGERERGEVLGSTRAVEYAQVLLAAPSAGPLATRRRLAFDALQAASARTLAERIAGSARGAAAPVTLARVQREVLRPGELLLDVHEGRYGSLAFAVTRTAFAVAELPSRLELDGRAERFLDVLGGGDAAVRDAAAASIARTYFGPFAGLMRGATRVLVCDGARLLPWTVLPGPDGAPLVTRREVAIAVSPTLLAATRAAKPAAPARGVLAVAGGADESGQRLDGAEEEVRWLAASFAGVDARLPGRVRDAAALALEMPRFDVLHLAGHAALEPQDPWSSGIRIGEVAGNGAWLRASTIARTRLRARLCVLAGCQSAGVSERGAGMLGLSTAFLCAGTASTLATLWPVDDRATARLVEDFYRALASGATAAGALREAQLRRRADPATAAPEQWAGFVLVGEPGTRVPLVTLGRRRP